MGARSLAAGRRTAHAAGVLRVVVADAGHTSAQQLPLRAPGLDGVVRAGLLRWVVPLTHGPDQARLPWRGEADEVLLGRWRAMQQQIHARQGVVGRRGRRRGRGGGAAAAGAAVLLGVAERLAAKVLLPLHHAVDAPVALGVSGACAEVGVVPARRVVADWPLRKVHDGVVPRHRVDHIDVVALVGHPRARQHLGLGAAVAVERVEAPRKVLERAQRVVPLLHHQPLAALSAVDEHGDRRVRVPAAVPAGVHACRRGGRGRWQVRRVGAARRGTRPRRVKVQARPALGRLRAERA
eukprot:CAMPEP_0179938034 /NCGR_PEP_ID=MMETSP0983-20121128/14694_1 /TAXON_ID=483367 /ORGANISM="non described non described, Strain CCMP 2436" /LENGTH=294 /DNA_ID=CAMNT_0021843895 /DNA_START=350 /DNA_END=1230 /DNA_ORIENTATION=+